jgi:hypothetical protein
MLELMPYDVIPQEIRTASLHETHDIGDPDALHTERARLRGRSSGGRAGTGAGR